MEIVKIRPLAEIETKYNEDGWQSWDESQLPTTEVAGL